MNKDINIRDKQIIQLKNQIKELLSINKELREELSKSRQLEANRKWVELND
jgi:regulator of replication initiation timing|tara:strand:- start:461 stop:613 length:153 start_codon:yes stop_codon:yes gene_type:complete